MAVIRGCELPEDLYYFIDKHVWAKPVAEGRVRVGMTSVAGKLSGGKLSAVTISQRKIGKVIKKGKSVAMVESSKYVGPVPAPVTGTLLRGNEKLAAQPNLPIEDPYGEGWIVEMAPEDWENEKAALAYGPDGVAAYRAALEQEDVSCS